ncbi:hypothetical protein LTR94_038157, partial [Friedmanniomyces endolithicus]
RSQCRPAARRPSRQPGRGHPGDPLDLLRGNRAGDGLYRRRAAARRRCLARCRHRSGRDRRPRCRAGARHGA